MLADVHPEARACIDDASPLVAICGTRRSGKSRSFLRKMAAFAATTEHARVIYLNETLSECENIAWIGNGRDGLLSLNEEFGLGGVPNHSKHTLTFPDTGGIIRLVGADDLRQVNKLRGIAPHLVVLDEAQKAPHLGPLIQQALGPAMMDYGGQIVMPGTPGVDLSGLFYDVTRDDGEPAKQGWSVHRLNVLSNPFFGDTPEERFERTVVKYCREHGLSLDDPTVQREWFARWVKTDARFVYAVHQVPEHTLCYAPARVQADGQPDIAAALEDLPQGHDWHFTLFCDLGFYPDPFAYVLWAWSWTEPRLYEVASWKQTKLDADQQLACLRWVAEQVDVELVGGDIGGATRSTGKGWSKRWMERFGRDMVEADKHRKHEYQELFNTDIRKGNVLMRKGGALHTEAKTVLWLPAPADLTVQRKLREDPRIPNDVCDAALYGHRHTMQHLAVAPTPKPEKGTSAYWKAFEERIEDEETREDDAAESYYS